MSSTMNHHKPLLLLLQLLLLQLLHLVAAPSASTFTNHTAAPPEALPCLPDQESALLQLKQSFAATNHSTIFFRSWRAGTDCCNWHGVRCGDADGRVTCLDLGDSELKSRRLDPVIFELTSLRYLNLAGNDFNKSKIPSTGFDRLTKLTHLNLSTCNFAGHVPSSIGRLTNLVSLDLSFRFESPGPFHMDYKFLVDFADQRQLKLPDLKGLVANLGSLSELRLGFVDMSDQEEDWCHTLSTYTPNLLVLSMPFCELSGRICGRLAGLHSLSVLNLQHNHLTGAFPEFFSNFSSLSVLQLINNDLHGWVPSAIFHHKNLVTIDLHQNPGISGTLPNFSAGSNLENLIIGSTNFSGAIPSSIGNLKYLKKLGLGAQGFAGDLPSSIGELKFLNSFQVSGLQVVGSIPSWITNLTFLEVLEFSHCGLYGPIPSSIGNLMKLRILALYRCKFSGKIPPDIYNLTQLDTLQLHSNYLIGKVELKSLRKLPNLSDLSLSDNKLNVIDEEDNSSLATFPDIKSLELSSCSITKFPNVLRHLDGIYVLDLSNNQITKFPNVLRHLDGIYELDLSNNQIHGAIPKWAWDTWSYSDIFYLNLSHNKFTSVGHDNFLPLEHIEVLDLSFNMLEGQIPIPNYSGTVLDYSSNRFSSVPLEISTQLDETAIFKASRNRLSGNISPSFCSTNLQFLDLSYNILSGSIPSCLMENVNTLKVLNLKENQLQGELPRNINKSCALQGVDFSGNLIEGQLPRSVASCKNLEFHNIGNNQISDSFPCWMSTLPRLQVLILNSNKFFGQLAPSVAKDKEHTCEFPSLRILDLASNNFSGTLTGHWFMKLKSMMVNIDEETSAMEYKSELQRLQQEYQVSAALTYKGYTITFNKIPRTLVIIDVSNNAFHGSIPEAIGELVLLNVLNISHNSLTGPVPLQLGSLNKLESLDFSSNDLSGVIPQELASLDFLSTLNLSDNMLEGRIPQSPHFLTFSNSSFMGNTGLCGPPLSNQCNNKTAQNLVQEKKSADVMLFLFVGLGFGAGFAAVIVVEWVLPVRKIS